MNDFDQLSFDIRSRLDRVEATGWHSCFCPVCKETSRRTGGFLFEPDSITYNCFRGKCDATTRYVFGEYVPKKFKALMQEMHIQIPIPLLTVKKKSKLAEKLEEVDDRLYKRHDYKTVMIPDGFVPFDQSKHPNKDAIHLHFESRLSVVDDLYIVEKGEYAGLPAYPVYLYGKIVGFRLIGKSGKYIPYYEGNTHLLYCPEQRIRDTVVVVEGDFDARCFPNTVATMSNKISPEQAFHLRGKRVIMLPDRSGGNRFIEQFHQYGWEISIPDWEEKDLNAAAMKYGLMVTARKIMDSTIKNRLEAEMRFKLWAK